MQVLPRFLSPGDVELLVRLARDPARTWDAGRQGTGYHRSAVTGPEVERLATRSLEAIWPGPRHGHDVWLLRYPPGSHIPPHVDPPLVGGAYHARLNAVIVAPPAGGMLVIDGVEVALAVGDAVVFRPDVERHAVTTTQGERLVWSVGCNYEPR